MSPRRVVGGRVGWRWCTAAAPALLLTVACRAAAPPASFYATPFEKRPSAATLTALGRRLFTDGRLSASGATACATCHEPARGFGPANGLPVQRAGVDGRSPGLRAVPSLTYTQAVPSFTEHYFDDDGNDSVDQGPAGGSTWDGRAATVHDQAKLPLLSPFEMANRSAQEVVNRVRSAGYADEFRDAFGQHFFDDVQPAFNGILWALEVYQQSPAEFYPFSSKYDAWLRGQAELNAAEERGRQLFGDPARGNCARCHPDGIRGGAFPVFTDYGYVALGVPRNAAIPANDDAAYFDLGLCGPLRTDLALNAGYCGMFRTPSLRNVALRAVYFHNGVVHSLRDAVRFYADRDSNPERWYPRAPDGTVRKFNDLPAAYQRNVEMDAPFGAKAGDPPALTDAEIDDLVAFLGTLTDGYARGRAANTPGAR
jgi:cytochrome c peroxidase